jgi:hypothetical protein
MKKSAKALAAEIQALVPNLTPAQILKVLYAERARRKKAKAA